MNVVLGIKKVRSIEFVLLFLEIKHDYQYMFFIFSTKLVRVRQPSLKYLFGVDEKEKIPII